MANICFGCHDVEDIEKCPKKDCTHYYHRERHLEMDTAANDERTRIARRVSREISQYRISAGIDQGLK